VGRSPVRYIGCRVCGRRRCETRESGEIEGADAVIRPVAEAFKQLFKLGCELGPPRFFDESPEQGDLFYGELGRYRAAGLCGMASTGRR
jgi:hypothetical protein